VRNFVSDTKGNHRLRIFGNRVLRRIFGSKRKKVAGGWRRLRNVELQNLYASPFIIRMIIKENEMDGPRSTHGRGSK
jgi:hypothetical protein